MALSHLVTFSIILLRILDIKVNTFKIELTNFMMQHFLQGINLNILVSLIVTLAFNNIRHFVKVQLVNKGIEFNNLPSIC